MEGKNRKKAQKGLIYCISILRIMYINTRIKEEEKEVCPGTSKNLH
jgi:hypothetical protein